MSSQKKTFADFGIVVSGKSEKLNLMYARIDCNRHLEPESIILLFPREIRNYLFIVFKDDELKRFTNIFINFNTKSYENDYIPKSLLKDGYLDYEIKYKGEFIHFTDNSFKNSKEYEYQSISNEEFDSKRKRKRAYDDDEESCIETSYKSKKYKEKREKKELKRKKRKNKERKMKHTIKDLTVKTHSLNFENKELETSIKTLIERKEELKDNVEDLMCDNDDLKLAVEDLTRKNGILLQSNQYYFTLLQPNQQIYGINNSMMYQETAPHYNNPPN